MTPLQARGPVEQAEKHRSILDVREYDKIDPHTKRIREARRLLYTVIDPHRVTVELGCGTADIIGNITETSDLGVAKGFEVNPLAAARARERWPRLEVFEQDINTAEAFPCHTLILCEVLEHLPDPLRICHGWMPLADRCLISSPLNGDLKFDSSAGEHQWTFGQADFEEFLSTGNHELITRTHVMCGNYNIQFMLSKRVNDRRLKATVSADANL